MRRIVLTALATLVCFVLSGWNYMVNTKQINSPFKTEEPETHIPRKTELPKSHHQQENIEENTSSGESKKHKKHKKSKEVEE
jgi:hypothetical protein